jgi:TolB protein
MMTHRLADELVYRYVGEPGIARTKIAFVSGTGGSRELFVMDYDGYSPRQVTANGLLNISPSWSPKRRFLIYTSYKHRTRQNIEIIELETGKRHTLVSWAGMNITPAFSPDGTQLTFSTTRDGNAEIYKMDMQTRLAKRLTANRAGDLSPSWSPTGRELAFTSDRSGGPQIYLMSADGSHVRRLTFHGKYNAAPAWSPRGNWIAYVCRGRGKFKICLISPDGRKRKTITSGPGIDDSPSWSPDGRHLVFVAERSWGFGLLIVDRRTGRVRSLLGGRRVGLPDWSPALKSS